MGLRSTWYVFNCIYCYTDYSPIVFLQLGNSQKFLQTPTLSDNGYRKQEICIYILLLLSLHLFVAETTGTITFLKSAARVPFCFEDTDQWVCIAVNTHQICKYAGLEKFCEWLPDGSRLGIDTLAFMCSVKL